MKQSVLSRLLLVLLIFTFLLSAAFIGTLRTTNRQKNDAVTINMGGRQRMLSQKMTKELMLYVLTGDRSIQKQIATTRTIFNESLMAMKDGGSLPLDLGRTEFTVIPGAENTEIFNQLEKVASIWSGFQRRMDQIMNAENNDMGVLTSFALEDSINLLTNMNAAVVMMQKAGELKIRKLIHFQLIILALSILVIFLSALYIRNTITRPLIRITAVSDKIAEGNLSEQALEIKTRDELGALSASFSRMRSSLEEKSRVLEAIAHKDLTGDVHIESDKDSLGISLKTMSQSLNSAMRIMNQIGNGVAVSSSEIARASESLAQTSTEQASSLQEISASLELINAGAGENAKAAMGTFSLAEKMKEDARKGGESIEILGNAMEEINSSAAEIKNIVKVIDDIAFQINLLALNANVEAARAGKYGRGFAVVADEVRTLAVNSAKAVQDTTSMVENALQKVSEGDAAAKSTTSALNGIISMIDELATATEGISHSSKEQASSISEITQGLGQIDEATQSNTATAEESSSAAHELASQAQDLREITAEFHLKEESPQWQAS